MDGPDFSSFGKLAPSQAAAKPDFSSFGTPVSGPSLGDKFANESTNLVEGVRDALRSVGPNAGAAFHLLSGGLASALSNVPGLSGAEGKMRDADFSQVAPQQAESARLQAKAQSESPTGALLGNVGSTVGTFAAAPEAAAPELAADAPVALRGLMELLTHAPGALASSAAQTVNTPATALAHGATVPQAETLLGEGIPGNAAPYLAAGGTEGNVLRRIIEGAVANTVPGQVQQATQHAIAPQQVAAPTAQSAGPQAAIGAVLGALMGSHAPEAPVRTPEAEPAPAPAPLALPPPNTTIHVAPSGEALTPAQHLQVLQEMLAGARQTPAEAAASANHPGVPTEAPAPAPAATPAPAPAATPAPAPQLSDTLARIVQAAQAIQNPSAATEALADQAKTMLAEKPLPKASKGVALTPGMNRVSTLAPATPAELADLDNLKAAKAAGRKLSPQATALYADLLEKSQNSARVGAKPIPGVLSMAALDHMRATLGKAPAPTGMIDIDNFKNINDELGHPMGDEVIRGVGAEMAKVFGVGNVIHRGGDEFLTLGDPDHAKMAAFQKHMAETPATFEDAAGNVRTFEGVKISVGSARANADTGVNELEQSIRSDKDRRAAENIRRPRAETDRRAARPISAEPDAGGTPIAPETEPAGNAPAADIAGNGVDHVGAGIPPDLGAVRPAGDGVEPAADDAQADLAFSKSRPGERPAGTSVDAARAMLAKSSKGATTRMERMGSLQIHPTGDVMPGGDANARAVFDGRKLHVAANRVTADTSMPLLLHEAMHTDLRTVLGTKYNDFMAQASQLAKTDPIARRAVAGIPADTPADKLPEEQAAHIAEYVATQKPQGISANLAAFARRFYHAVRSHIYTSKIGGLAQKAGMNLGPEDIAAFSRRAASSMFNRGGRVESDSTLPSAAMAAKPVGAHIPMGPVDTLYDKVAGPYMDKIGNGVASLFKKVYLESRLSPADKADLVRARTVKQGAKFEAEDIAHDSASFTPEDRKTVGDYIEGMVPQKTIPPQHVVVEAQKMQDALKGQRERLIAVLGEQHRAFFEDPARPDLGVHYIARVYDKNMPKEMAAHFKNSLSGSVKADFMRSRGIFKTIPKDQLQAFKELGWTADTHLVQALNGKRLDDKLTVWRDHSPAERAAMGENTDANYRFVKTWTQTEQFIAMHTLYANLAKRYAHLGPSDGVRVPDEAVAGSKIPKYGKLAGTFVPPEVAKEILGGFEPTAAANQTITKMTNLWKYGKVSNSRTVIADLFGKAIFAHLGGHSLLNPLNVIGKDSIYARAIHATLTKGPDFRHAVELGGAQNDIISHADASDLRSVMQPQGDTMAAVHADWLNRLLTVGKKIVGAPLRPWSGMLHGGTNIFKMAAIYNALDHGASWEQAVAHANLYHFDFNDIPPGMRQLQKYSAFANWTRLAIKAAGHSALHSPHRYAAVIGGFAAYNLLASVAEMGTPNSMLEKDEKKALPRHIQESNPMFLTTQASILPMKADNGDNIWVDTSSAIPGRDLTGSNQVQTGAPLPSWMMPTNPMITVPISVITGIDPYSGQHLTQETDSPLQRAEKIGGNVAESLEPTEYGMLAQSAEQLASGHDYKMKPYGVGDAITTQLARVHKVGPEDVQPMIRERFEHNRSLINKSRWQIKDAGAKLAQQQTSLQGLLKRGEISKAQYARDIQSAQAAFESTREASMQNITRFDAKMQHIQKEASGG